MQQSAVAQVPSRAEPRREAHLVGRRRLRRMSVVHSFDPPDRFVTGTVGPPGQRTFFLQARAGDRLISVALEKQQVAALAERLETLLDELLRAGATEALVPAATPTFLFDNGPLDQPIEEEFRVGTMTLSWDGVDERVVIEVFPVTEQLLEIEERLESGEPGEEVEAIEPEEMVLVRIGAAAARAFAERATRVLGAGRASCPFCGQPVEPDGHLCPRANGFRRRDP